MAASVKAMEAGFDYAKLDPETKLSWDLWKRQHEDARDGLAFLGNGYRFAPTTAANAGSARHELPGLWFSENEIHALLTMHQLLASLDDDGVLARHLQPLMEKLQGMLGTDESAARELMRRVKVIGTARRRVPSRHFELLGSALLQRRRLRLRYFKRSDRRPPCQLYLVSPLDVTGGFPDRLKRAFDAGPVAVRCEDESWAAFDGGDLFAANP